MKQILLLCLSCCFVLFAQAQEERKVAITNGKNLGKEVGTRSRVLQTDSPIFIDPKKVERSKDFMVSFNGGKALKHEVPNRLAYEQKLARKTSQKFSRSAPDLTNTSTGANDKADGNTGFSSSNSVSSEKGFYANLSNGTTPPDNAIAISDNGYIISATNRLLQYYKTDGTRLFSSSLTNFFDFLNPAPTGNLFDPKVLYDPVENRFIMIVLHKRTGVSEVLTCFSKTQNPMDGWWVYRIAGDPGNKGRWIDYVNIGVSTRELYISGNLYNSSDSFQEVVLYQINKRPGFTGGNINWLYWLNISTPDGAECKPFTLVPLSYGIDGSHNGYGPGIYLVSTCSGGGSKVYLWDVTKGINDDPRLKSYSISTGSYDSPGDAKQKGSTDLLSTGGCRIRSGFYMNGYAHFVFITDYQDAGYSRIRYNRLKTSDRTLQYLNYGRSGYDYCYPSIASVGKNNNDKAVVIGFLRSASNLYPQTRAFTIGQGVRDYSNSSRMKSGSDYVEMTSGRERWGDYTGICYDYNSPSSNPKTWFAGHYGRYDNNWRTYISKISTSGNSATGTNHIAATSNEPESPTGPYGKKIATDMQQITFNTAAQMEVRINILDGSGKLLKTIYQGRTQKGKNTLDFNKKALKAGTYFVRVQASSKKIIADEKFTVRT